MLTQLTVKFTVKKKDGSYLKNNKASFLKDLYSISLQIPTFTLEATVGHHGSMCKYHLPHRGICKDHSSRLDAGLFVECHISTRGCLWWLSYKVLFRTVISNSQNTNNSDHVTGWGLGSSAIDLKNPLQLLHHIVLNQLDLKSSSLS